MGRRPDRYKELEHDRRDGSELLGADGVREPQDAGAHPAEQGRDPDQHADEREHEARIAGNVIRNGQNRELLLEKPACEMLDLQSGSPVLLELCRRRGLLPSEIKGDLEWLM